RCNGWTAGTGSVSPPTQLGANFTSVDLSPLTTNTAWTWAWQTQFAVTVITNPSGYISIQELGSDNDPNDLWADSNTFVRVTVTAFDPAKYEPDYVSVNGTRFDLSATYQVDVLVTNAITLASSFRTSSQDDPGFVAYMARFGLKAGNVGQRTFDDPDNDGLSNQQEYQLSVTNKSWYYNPINSDTDGDGMDDKYEYESVDPTNLTEAARASYRPAAVDNGSGSVDNGPEGNPDGDYHWSTTDGYRHLEQPLMNIEEYRGPDNIAPYTNAAVNFGDVGYPFPSNPVGNRPTVYVRVAVPGDTGDQSKGNAENSDRDTYDDGFEYSWDQWQHWGRTNVASLIGGTQEVFMVGVTNMVGIYYTNTIPNWATARVFNPGHTDVVGNGPDNDVLYDYQLGKVSQYWYDASREYNVWRPDALSPGIAGAPHSIRMDSPPNGEASPRRCSHPFMWDVDLDGLPDGYEVVFGYDPWANRTIGHTVPDGQDNPDDDWMAWAEADNAFSLRNHEVYVSTNYLNVVFPCTNYDPRVAVAQFYPTPDRMPGPGTAIAPKTKRYSNADEMRGPDGIMTIVPVTPGLNIDDATHPFKVDSDDDGIWDGWENYVGLNASSAIDAGVDGENDGLNSLAEFQSFFTSSTNRSALVPVADWNNKIFPTDPNSGDSDGDKVGDGGEKGFFNGIVATATNIFLDETGAMTTQVVARAVWSGNCYLSGGLNPTSSDTDADTLPDPYEASYPATAGGTGLDGTIRDAFGDADRDKLPNYIEYYTCAIMPWQQGTPSFTRPVNPDDYFGGTDGTPKAWDWSQQIYIPLYPDESGVGRFGYSGTCPNMVDSDEDGMDDYYEIYHGICPVYGIVDEMLSRILARGRIPVGPPLRPFVGDIRSLVYVSGTPMMDPDGDGLPNSEEAVNVTRPFLTPQYHTDPSPLWVTDMGYAGSWVNKYYTPGFVWPWCGPRPPEFPPVYAFDFECNEGFDSDNDGYSDREELVVTQTDPISPERPIKRRALYLPAEKDAYARTFPGFVKPLDQLRSFTVEAWVRPLNPASGMNQTIVERPIVVPAGNIIDQDSIRVNFRLGIDPTGLPYIAYNGEGAEGIFYIAKAGTASRVSANNWSHLAGTYSVPSPIDPSQRGVLTLYVNGQMAAQTNPNELPATARYGNNPSEVVNVLIGAPIIVGASDGFPLGDMDVTTIMIPSPVPFDFFKGWVDEVRVWDGARTLPEVVTGMKMRMKQVDVINSQNTTVPMCYHFSFDDLPDPDHTPTAPAGLGFDVTGNYIFPSDYTGVGFWATEASRSQVYAGLGGGDPRYVPWIWNTVAHIPLLPPTDIGDPNAVVNLPDGTNAP
ncbi:MAG: LamG domain-containing protein, partial [bacterium]